MKAKTGRRMVALIPAFNEEERIVGTIEGLRSTIPDIEIFVVDDGSMDNTTSRARAAGAHVLEMPRNMGKGNALNAAFRDVRFNDEDYLLLIDADLGATSSEAAALLEPVLNRSAEMTVARFRTRGKGGFGLAKGLGRWGIRRLGGGYEATAPLSGQRVLRAGLFRDIGGLESGYGMEVGLSIDVLRRGGRIMEIEVDMSDNETGRDLAGWRHRGKQFRQIAWVIAKKSLTR
jgi:glycosyltransferase involved in cell wall biosynthesis